ncbi:MAG: VWA domain-containing protein, partial [Gammaproteobacteria bacterium]|nr:VWA domain-containing protein [Gammaproteobacteria bacterium]
MFIKFTSATTQLLHFSLALLIGLLSCTSALHADDFEIYLTHEIGPSNVLLLLDKSGSMNDCITGDNCPSNNRMDTLKGALDTFIDKVASDNSYKTNMGIMAFNGSLEVLSDFKQVSITPNAVTLKNKVNSLTAGGGTAVSHAVYKAIEWFEEGLDFRHGLDDDQQSDGAITTVTSYPSPIPNDANEFVCGTNHIILLTDGHPKAYPSYKHIFGDMVETANEDTTKGDYWIADEFFQYDISKTNPVPVNCAKENIDDMGPATQLQRKKNHSGVMCNEEMVKYGYETDLKTGGGWDPDVQNITTHTVYFGTNQNSNTFTVNAQSFMEKIALAGNGGFYFADSLDSLYNAFIDTLSNTVEATSYTSPSIPFDSTNAAVTGNSIYIPMFAPNKKMFWKGNLKKFNIKIENGAVSIVTNNNSDAFNDAGIFNDVNDYWNTGSSDDGDPLIGGVASQMTGIRKLYSNIVSDNDLTLIGNRVIFSNTNITNTMMGAADNAAREELLDWVSWTDTTNEHENEMGAPLHTNPIAVEYGSDVVIYLPTSEGVLEAIDEDTGEELWAFMPEELLKGIKTIKDNISSNLPYYGIDGHLTIYDIGNNKYAAFGMRRGGSNYYILDITNKASPEYVTTISPITPEFADLGQTWSKPIHIKMYIKGVTGVTEGNKDVLVFGGGYDEDHDNHSDVTTRTASNKGHRIYIVDATTGAHLKTISTLENGSSLEYSIVGDIVPIDINANGIIDRLYAADIGGKIIRVDIQDEDMQDKGIITAGIVADVNAGGGGWRRFFNTPLIGFYNKGGVESSVILIGSGNRESPTNSTTTDRFYMIKDINVWSIPDYDATAYEIVKGWDEGSTGDLYNATNNHMSNDSSLAAVASAKGWFIDFESTEKSYSKPVLWQNNIMFTTLQAQD